MPGNPEEKAATLDKKSQGQSTETQEEIDWKAKYEEAEKRRRDTQAAYTKSRQELKMLKAEREALEKQVLQLDLSVKQTDELEELKFQDPDKWRQEVNRLEEEAKKAKLEALNQATNEAKTKAELEHRLEVLEEFQKAHPEVHIDDEVIANDIPPRITKKLENGEISFEEFLDEVHGYLTTPKKVAAGEEPPKQVNLGKVGGRDTASEHAVSEDIVASYQNEVY